MSVTKSRPRSDRPTTRCFAVFCRPTSNALAARAMHGRCMDHACPRYGPCGVLRIQLYMCTCPWTWTMHMDMHMDMDMFMYMFMSCASCAWAWTCAWTSAIELGKALAAWQTEEACCGNTLPGWCHRNQAPNLCTINAALAGRDGRRTVHIHAPQTVCSKSATLTDGDGGVLLLASSPPWAPGTGADRAGARYKLKQGRSWLYSCRT